MGVQKVKETHMRTKGLLLVIVTLLAALAIAGDVNHVSFIGLSNTKGKVGEHFSAQVHYDIGWFTPRPGGGTIDLSKSDISDPEYGFFGDIPPGLHMTDDGYVVGEPTKAGTYIVYPAVRDKKHKMYHGRGFWHTEWITDSATGLEYAEPKEPGITITIEP
jgi:hypothetical protein